MINNIKFKNYIISYSSGLVIGILCSVLATLYRAAAPQIRTLGRTKEGVWLDASTYKTEDDGVRVIQISGPMYFMVYDTVRQQEYYTIITQIDMLENQIYMQWVYLDFYAYEQLNSTIIVKNIEKQFITNMLFTRPFSSFFLIIGNVFDIKKYIYR